MTTYMMPGHLQGFSVYQPALGAQLVFFPALGSNELDQLIDAYLPGSASAKEKRATISIDFFEHARLTGENFKFYTVDPVVATVSPVSASPAGWDSAYGSGFDLSPALSDVTSWSFASLPQHQQATHSAPSPVRQQHKQKSRPAKRASIASARTRPSTDFSSLPGMKILTKDGQDVTNSASRGCKTKEQRDHAHLMRVIKACDSCRRKKIRCDPSHKKRIASSQPQAEEAHPTKKAKRMVESPVVPLQTPALDSLSTPFDFDLGLLPVTADNAIGADHSWEQFVQFDQDLNFPPEDLDFFLDSTTSFSPVDLQSSSSSSGLSLASSPSQPSTPVHHRPGPVNAALDGQLQQQQEQAATRPYHDSFEGGADYIDFNLYSPQSNFLDEEPILLKSAQASHATWEDEPRAEFSLEPLEAISQSWSTVDGSARLPLSGVQHEPSLDIGDIDWEREENIGGGERSTFPLACSNFHSPTATAHPSQNLESLSVSTSTHPETSYNHYEPSRRPLAGSERLFQGPSHPESRGAYRIESHSDTIASQYSSLSAVTTTPRVHLAGSPTHSNNQAIASWASEAAPRTFTGSVLFSEAGGSVPRNRSPSPSMPAHAANTRSGEDEVAVTASPAILSGSEIVLDSPINAAPAYSHGSGRSQPLYLDAVLGLGNGSAALALGAAVLVLVLVLSGVLLTLQAGSAKMPKGFFGLVYGGVMVLAQALWPHTPPRSSKPAPKDYYFFAPGRGVAATDGGWLNGKTYSIRSSLQCSIGEKISRSSGSTVFSWRQLSSWRL